MATDAVERNLVEKVAARVVRIVGDHAEDGIAERGIWHSLSKRQRDVMREAIDLALERGEIHLRTDPGQGDDKRRYYPGPDNP